MSCGPFDCIVSTQVTRWIRHKIVWPVMRKLAIDQFLFKLVCIFYGDLLYKSANQELLYPIEAIFILIWFDWSRLRFKIRVSLETIMSRGTCGSLYRQLCNVGIQYRVREINYVINWLWWPRISSFVSLVGVYVGLPMIFSITSCIIKQFL